MATLLGVYLTAASLVLFVIARDTTIFQDWFGLRTLTDPEIRGLLYMFVSLLPYSLSLIIIITIVYTHLIP